MRTFLTILLLSVLINPFKATAQSPAGKYAVTGIVSDSVTKKPVPYISASLKKGNTVIKATAADADGFFKLPGLNEGNYMLSVSATDYNTKTIAVTIDSANGAYVLNVPVSLSQAINKVKQVVVTAAKPLIKQEIDRISYNLQADPESKSTSVLNMLRKVPFLSVDGNENILLKGKDDYRIFINGKPSSMLERDPKAILRSMPASSIERIEVITSPSSKYDAEGVGGIINIVTTKNVSNGYSASLNMSERFPVGGPSLGGSLTFKENKFGLSAYGGASTSNSPATTSFRSLEGTSNPALLNQNGFSENDARNGYFGTEISYEADSLNFISGSVNVNGGITNSQAGQNSALNNQSVLLQQYSLRNLNKTNGNGWDAAINYQLGFKRNKNRILTFSYSTYNYGNDLRSNQEISNRINYTVPDYRQSNNSNTKEQTVQIDYVHPLKNLNIEAGVKAIFRNNDGDFVYSSLNTVNGNFETDPTRSNLYINNQKIYSTYNTYQFKIKDWAFKGGFRLEQTIINANFISNATNVDQNYVNLLATVVINKKINDFNSFNLGYMQRVKRAGINKLNPFVDRSNPNFESAGNPNLRPSIMNNLQFGYNSFRKLNVNFSAEYNFARDLYIPITTYNAATQVSRTTFENAGNANRIGLNLNMRYPITKSWNVSTNASAEMISLLSAINGIQTRTNIRMYRAFLSSGYNFSKGWQANANVNYVSPSVTTLQGRKNGYLGTNFNINKDILKDKLSFSASLDNPFTKFRETNVRSVSDTFLQTDINYEYFRSFNLSVNYKFGKLKENIKKAKRGIKNDDLSN